MVPETVGDKNLFFPMHRQGDQPAGLHFAVDIDIKKNLSSDGKRTAFGDRLRNPPTEPLPIGQMASSGQKF